MRKYAVAAVAGLAFSGLAVAPATAADTTGAGKTSASAAERGSHCVTKKEFRRVKRHLTMKRVHRIFDTRGKQSYFYTIGGKRYTGRDYRPAATRVTHWSRSTSRTGA